MIARISKKHATTDQGDKNSPHMKHGLLDGTSPWYFLNHLGWSVDGNASSTHESWSVSNIYTTDISELYPEPPAKKGTVLTFTQT